MLSVSVVKVRRSCLRISRARRRQERSSLREGTTPPLHRALRTSRSLRFSIIKVRVPLQQSSLREDARDHCFRYVARKKGMEVCLGAIPPGTASLRLPKCQGAFEQRGCSAPSTFSRLRLAEPSGRPGGSRPRSLPPAGAAFVRSASLRAAPCPGRPASTLLPCTSIRRPVPVREHCSAPPSRQCRAHKVSRSGSGRGGRLSPLRVRSPPLR